MFPLTTFIRLTIMNNNRLILLLYTCSILYIAVYRFIIFFRDGVGEGGQIINKGATICHLNKIPSYDFSKAVLSLIYSCIFNICDFLGDREFKHIFFVSKPKKQIVDTRTTLI